MVSFKNHKRSEKITLTNGEGVEEEYEFVSISAKHLPKLFKVINQFQGISKDAGEEEFAKKLDEPTVELIVDLEKEMVKESYKSVSEEEVDSFVSKHFINLIEVLFKTNISQ